MDIFLAKLALSFVTASIWITLSTVIAEKSGSKIGGLVAGLPSTVAVALFFIGWVQTPAEAAEAAKVLPAMMAVYLSFVTAYIFILRRGFAPAITGSLAVWAVTAYVLFISGPRNLLADVVGFFILLAVCYWIYEKKLKISSQYKKEIEYTLPKLAFRVLLSGSIAAFAVYMARAGGPVLGGIFTAFPAATISAMYITYSEHGKIFSAAIVKTMAVSSITIVVYAVSAMLAYPALGLVLGTLVSLVSSLVSAYLVYGIAVRKMK